MGRKDNSNRKPARENWVAEQINRVQMNLIQKLDNIKSEIDFHVEILKRVLIEKLNIKREDIESVEKIVEELIVKDRDIITKYLYDEKLNPPEKYEKMIADGLSDYSHKLIKRILKIA